MPKDNLCFSEMVQQHQQHYLMPWELEQFTNPKKSPSRSIKFILKNAQTSQKYLHVFMHTCACVCVWIIVSLRQERCKPERALGPQTHTCVCVYLHTNTPARLLKLTHTHTHKAMTLQPAVADFIPSLFTNKPRKLLKLCAFHHTHTHRPTHKGVSMHKHTHTHTSAA